MVHYEERVSLSLDDYRVWGSVVSSHPRPEINWRIFSLAELFWWNDSIKNMQQNFSLPLTPDMIVSEGIETFILATSATLQEMLRYWEGEGGVDSRVQSGCYCVLYGTVRGKTRDQLSASHSMAAQAPCCFLPAHCIHSVIDRSSASVTGVPCQLTEPHRDCLESVDQKYDIIFVITWHTSRVDSANRCSMKSAFVITLTY